MKEGLLPPEGRSPVRRSSAGNLLEDPDAEAAATLRAAGGAPGEGLPSGAAPPEGLPIDTRVDIEDVLDKVGGLGRYQWGHLLLCAGFWFANVGTPISLFANSPWCLREGDPALCLAGDETVPKSPETWWSPCRSLACQFNLRPATCLGDDDGTGTACALDEAGAACAVAGGDCVFTPENGLNWRPLFVRSRSPQPSLCHHPAAPLPPSPRPSRCAAAAAASPPPLTPNPLRRTRCSSSAGCGRCRSSAGSRTRKGGAGRCSVPTPC